MNRKRLTCVLWGIVLPTLAAWAAFAGELTAQACIGTPISDGTFAATVEKLIGDRGTGYYGGAIAGNRAGWLSAEVEFGILTHGNYVYYDVQSGAHTLQYYDDHVHRYRAGLAYELPVPGVSTCVVFGLERGSLNLQAERGGGRFSATRIPLGLGLGGSLRPPNWATWN